jgi:hypothetical protein
MLSRVFGRICLRDRPSAAEFKNYAQNVSGWNLGGGQPETFSILEQRLCKICSQ